MEAKTGFHFFFLVYISSKGVRGLGSDRFQGLDTISLVLGNSNKAPGQARHSLLDSFTSPDHLYLPPPLSPTLHWINLCITVNLFVRIKVAKDNHENALTKNNFSHHQRSIVLLLFAKHSLSQFELFPVRISKLPISNEALLVKNPPANARKRVWWLGQEDSLEEETAPYSSLLAGKIPWAEKPDELQSLGQQRVRHYWVTHDETLLFYCFFLEFLCWKSFLFCLFIHLIL